jgi:hypothetical protein
VITSNPMFSVSLSRRRYGDGKRFNQNVGWALPIFLFPLDGVRGIPYSIPDTRASSIVDLRSNIH